MDINSYLKGKAFWQHSAPTGANKAEFNEALALGKQTGKVIGKKTLAIPSYAPGMYVSNFMPGEDGGSSIGEISLRAAGHLLTEHILTHANWKGESRLQDLIAWGSAEKNINRVRLGNSPYHTNSNNPTQFEWVLWQAKAAMADIADNKIPREVREAELAFIKEEVLSISKAWSGRKPQSPDYEDEFKAQTSGIEFLSIGERRCHKELQAILPYMFSVLSVPSSKQFKVDYNPAALSVSVKAGIELDERYHKVSDVYTDYPRDPDVDEEVDEVDEHTISDKMREFMKPCLMPFFVFENGTEIIKEIQAAKIAPGMRTVEIGTILDITKDVQEQFNIPAGESRMITDAFGNTKEYTAQISYGRALPAVKDLKTNKSVKSYIYYNVDKDGNILRDQENELVLSFDAHQAIRKVSSPILKMPEGLPDKARYLESKSRGGYDNKTRTYFYMDGDHKVFELSKDQHVKVMALNPDQVSANIRGKIDSIFTKFFVSEVTPNYRGYLVKNTDDINSPEVIEEMILQRNTIKEKLQPHIDKAWDEISKQPVGSAKREILAKKHFGEWLKLSMKEVPAEITAYAPTLFTTMKESQAKAIQHMISSRANEKALVDYMEESRDGKNDAEGYNTYGQRGKFKTWRTQIKADSAGKKVSDVMTERIATAVNRVEAKYGSLDAIVPETHKPDAVLKHFNKLAGGELRDELDFMGIPRTKGLVELAKYVDPISIQIFYARRITHLQQDGCYFDKPLPDCNLSRIAKTRNAERIKTATHGNKPKQQDNATPLNEQEELVGIDVGMD